MSKYADDYIKQSMWKEHGKKCFYCNEIMPLRNIQVDHVIPQVVFKEKENTVRNKYSLDASFDFNSLDNFVPACQSCNVKRKRGLEIENAIPIWLEEVKSKKDCIVIKAEMLRDDTHLYLPDQYKEFFLTSPDFLLSDLSLEKILKKDIDLYKGLAFDPNYYLLHLVSPENSDISIHITSLSQYEKYRDLGYYASTTPEIGVKSVCDSCLMLFEKFKDAILLERTLDFKQYYRSLPATILDVIGPEEDSEYKKYNSVGEYLDAQDDVIIEIAGNKIEIVINYKEFNEQEFYVFREVLQADFTGEGYNQTIVFVDYKSPGTFHCTFAIHATYLDDRLIPYVID